MAAKFKEEENEFEFQLCVCKNGENDSAWMRYFKSLADTSIIVNEENKHGWAPWVGSWDAWFASWVSWTVDSVKGSQAAPQPAAVSQEADKKAQ